MISPDMLTRRPLRSSFEARSASLRVFADPQLYHLHRKWAAPAAIRTLVLIYSVTGCPPLCRPCATRASGPKDLTAPKSAHLCRPCATPRIRSKAPDTPSSQPTFARPCATPRIRPKAPDPNPRPLAPQARAYRLNKKTRKIPGGTT